MFKCCKFCIFHRYIGCSSIAGRFSPGAFTNQIQAAFREPRLLLISNPRITHQPVTEASYANIPIVAFTKFIYNAREHRPDVVVPCQVRELAFIKQPPLSRAPWLLWELAVPELMFTGGRLQSL